MTKYITRANSSRNPFIAV